MKKEMQMSMLKKLIRVMLLKEMIVLFMEKFLLLLKNNPFHLLHHLLHHHNYLKISLQHLRTRSTETSDGLAAIQAQLNNLRREIKQVNKKVYAAQVGCELCKGPHYTKDCTLKEEDDAIRNQGALIKTFKIQIGQISKVLQERGFGTFPNSTKTNMRDHVKSISTTVEADMTPICHIRSSQYVVLAQQNGASASVMPLSTYLNLDFIILDMPEDVKVPLILGRPFLSTTHSKIDVFKRKITLRVRDEKIIFKSVKPASSLIKRVYMLSLRKRMELDLEAKIMGETLVLNISLDPLYGDYIELNDLNVPLVLRRDKVDDLMPTIKEAVEDMDHYLDEGIGEVDESVTYQMVWSILRFRRHTNEQCNKIPPLLKNLILFEIQRWKNGSHAGTKAFMRLNEGS
nr:hypothetical protein [Tanacetum cinerariifolium]